MNQKQHLLTAGPLHDPQGRLCEAGYATALVKQYDRSRIAAPNWRIKEWDYYYIGNDTFGLALTVADNGYMTMDSISLLDFEKAWSHTASRMRFLPRKRRDLPATSHRGDIQVSGKGYALSFLNDGEKRTLYGSMEGFLSHKPLSFDITLTDVPRDSMVIATPFPNAPKAFYYNQKINCLRAAGRVMFDGREYLFSPATAFAVLDWGRGVWTYDNTWYWASASGICQGHRFGFNLGYGFGDTSAATENMLFWDGAAQKLGQVRFDIPQSGGKPDYLSPWQMQDTDGKLSLTFHPILDRAARTDVKLICSDQHQVFGRYTGQVILQDGTRIEVRDFIGFAEKVRNKW